MATRQQSIAGISSRRSACDKCRGLKAKCLRAQPQQARCDRCRRTDSECFTSPIFRVRRWQPPGGNEGAAAVLGGDSGSSKDQRRSSQHHSPQSPTVSDTNLVADMDALETETEHDHDDIAASYQGSSWHKQWSETDLSDTFGGELEGQIASTFAPVGSTFDINMSESFFAVLPSATTEAASLPSLPLAYSSSIASGSMLTPEFSPDSDINAIEGNGRVSRDTKQTLMQRLSKLDYELITTLSRVSDNPHGVVFRALLEIRNAPASSTGGDNILDTTKGFIELLKLMAESCLPFPAASPVAVNELPKKDARGRQPSVCSSSYSDYDSVAESPDGDTFPADQSSFSTFKSQKRYELDASSLLSILNVYIRHLRLYVIIFEQLYDYLDELSRSDDPQVPPISGFSISDFPIESGSLQTLIVIQIVTSLFERMDELLGLPKEYRMSKRRGEQRGLLSAPGFVELTRSILEQEEKEGCDGGKGGIKVLRKHIAKAKHLLRECIAP